MTIPTPSKTAQIAKPLRTNGSVKHTPQPQEDLGTCSLSPHTSVIAGAFGTWTMTYTCGAQTILPGGGIAVVPPNSHGIRWRVGHVTAATTGSCALSLRVRHGYPLVYHHAQFPVIFVAVEGGTLQPGEEIRVVLGDAGGFISGFYERARAQEIAQPGATFQVLVDPLGNSSYSNVNYPGGQPRGFRLLPHLPAIDVLAGPPQRLAIIAPARIAPGEPFDVLVRVEDAYGNVCAGFAGEIAFGALSLPHHRSQSVEGPATVHLTAAGNGAVRAGPFRLSNDQPLAAITAQSWDLDLCAQSNPIEVVAPQTARIFFGDLHTHAPDALGEPKPRTPFSSYGFGTFEQAHTYARDVAGLDFVAIAWFPPPQGIEALWSPPRGEDWAGYRTVTQQFHTPGRFVPLPAVELSDPPTGHRVVLFPSEDAPELRCGPLAELWSQLDGTGAVVVPHHINASSEGGPQNWEVQDWSQHNPHYQPVLEISQSRGAFETDAPEGPTVIAGRGASAQDALAQGHRLGFVGGTDNHYGQPGTNRCPMGGVDYHDRVTGGLTAVFAPDLTRDAILDALRARRCYTTTGARIIVEFSVDGVPMGSEITRAPGDVCVAASVHGTAPIDRLEIIRDGQVVHRQPGEGRTARLEHAAHVDTGSYFYLRVTQSDGQVAWSSPVWVDIEGREYDR